MGDPAKVYAAKYAVLEPERDRYKAALLECARLSGSDVSDGPPTEPPLDEWAPAQVKQLRDEYDRYAELW